MDDGRWLNCALVFSLEVRFCSIHLFNLLDDSDEEATSVLVVRHDTEALREFSKNGFIVVLAEHGFFNVRAKVCWNILKGFVGLKIGQVGVAIWLLFQLVDSIAVRLLLHVEERPAGDTLLESEAAQSILRLQKSDFAWVLLKNCSDDRLVLNRVQRTGRVGYLSANFKELDAALKDLNLKLMQGLAPFSVPLLPLGGNLTDSGVRAARNVRDDTIVANPTVFTNFAVLVKQLWENLSIVVGDDDVGGI